MGPDILQSNNFRLANKGSNPLLMAQGQKILLSHISWLCISSSG
uniref:Uncharacterized protein n=1 Tax=Anguilla anguilla TaxID=7936 RepID=A0A0E9T5I3_ANGAN